MVSCPRPLADRLRPVFDAIGKFFWIGDKPVQTDLKKALLGG